MKKTPNSSGSGSDGVVVVVHGLTRRVWVAVVRSGAGDDGRGGSGELVGTTAQGASGRPACFDVAHAHIYIITLAYIIILHVRNVQSNIIIIIIMYSRVTTAAVSKGKRLVCCCGWFARRGVRARTRTRTPRRPAGGTHAPQQHGGRPTETPPLPPETSHPPTYPSGVRVQLSAYALCRRRRREPNALRDAVTARRRQPFVAVAAPPRPPVVIHAVASEHAECATTKTPPP